MPGKEIKGKSKIASYKKGGRVKVNQGGYIGRYIKGDLGGQKFQIHLMQNTIKVWYKWIH